MVCQLQYGPNVQSLISIAALFIFLADQSFANETIVEYSVGLDAVDSRGKSEVIFNADGALLDGAVTSFPPDQTTFDRTAMGLSRIGFNARFTPTFSLRFIAESRYHLRRQYEEEQPRRIVEERWFEGRPSLDFTYYTVGGVELFGGVQARIHPAHKLTTDTVSFDSEVEYGEAYYAVPRAGLVKRTGYVTGSAYFESGRQKQRDVKKKASDGTEVNTADTVYSPTKIGILFRFDISSYTIDAEFVAIQAADFGPQTPEGERTLEDYTRFRLGAFIPYDKAIANFHVGVIHKTLSYADSSFMSLKTIPMTTAHLKVIQGSQDQHIYLGVIYGYARDTQSLPEFNAKYAIDAYGAKLGGIYKF